jgi:Uma2 family endonuclease
MIGMLNARIRELDLPYSLRFFGVTEEMFDELVDKDTKAELINGVMFLRSSLSMDEDDLLGLLRTLLRGYAAKKHFGKVLGPRCLVHLKAGWKVTPRILFVAQDRVPSPLPELQFEIAPDLVVELFDKVGRYELLNEKVPAYKEAGVREIWVVAPEERLIHVHRRRGKHYTDQVHTSGPGHK